jgi:hypothetical protein
VRGLEANHAAPRHTRRFVRTTLEQWHQDDLADVASALAGDIVAKVMNGGATRLHLRLQCADDALRVEVWLPLAVALGAFDRDGLRSVGQRILEAHAEEWGHASGREAAVVWFSFETSL